MSARFTVKQVAEQIGVPAATLRAWERRYAVVTPRRSGADYRLYDQDEVARLARMADLVRQGSPASLAAEHVLATMPLGAAATPAGLGGAELPVEDLVRAGQTLDQQLLTRLVDDAFARASFESAVDHWLLPALTAVGEAWERGDLDVAGEHFVAAAVQRRLALAFEAAGPNTGAPVALVGVSPGSLHVLGALTFATCLRRQGVDVRFLGADLPEESWLRAATTVGPAAAVLSVPTPRDARAARRLLVRLAADHPAVRVWAGGQGAAAAVRAGGGSAARRAGDGSAAGGGGEGSEAGRGGDGSAAGGAATLLDGSPVAGALDVAQALQRR